MRKTRNAVLTVVFAVFFALTQIALGQAYKITDLGTLGGNASRAFGVNSRGQVVGWASDAGGVQRAFLYSTNGGMQLLDPAIPGESMAFSINDNSEVCGKAHGQAFVFVDGMYRDISSSMTPEIVSSTATKINNGRLVAVTLQFPWGYEGLLYTAQSGMFEYLCWGSTNCLSRVYGVNGDGTVVGIGMNSVPTAYLSNIELFRSLTDQSGCAYDINDKGMIAGNIFNMVNLSVQAFLYNVRSNVWTVYGNATPYAINEHDVAVGSTAVNGMHCLGSYIFSDSDHAVILTPTGGTVDLNSLIDVTLGWKLQIATDINNAGQIVGWGINPQGKERAFLLTPNEVVIPIIVRQPSSKTVPIGKPFNLMVKSTNSPTAVEYQWYFNDMPIDAVLNPTAGTANLIITNASSDNSGRYQVALTVPGFTTWSDVAEVEVLPELGIALVPVVFVNGTKDRTYNIVYRYSNGPLVDWTFLGAITLTNGTGRFPDFEGIGKPQRFYRAVEVSTKTMPKGQ